MRFKNLLSVLFAAFTLTLSACRDNHKDTPEPVVPAAELTLNRLFSYPNATQLGADYDQATIKALAAQNETAFHFYAGVKTPEGQNAAGNDHINFVVAPDQVKPGFVGTYGLKSFADPQAGEAKVSFIHYTSGSGGNIFDSQFNTITGSYQITAYDARNKLISGRYDLVIKAAADPYAPAEERFNPRKIDITIRGTFTNVPVQKQL